MLIILISCEIRMIFLVNFVAMVANLKCHLKSLAKEQHQNVSGLLTEAIREYVKRKRVRPAVLTHLEASMEQNKELGKLLAK